LRILSVGEILWDVFEENEFLGGAPLNFAVSAQRLGNTVSLLSAVGSDARGTRAISSMRNVGISTDLVQTASSVETATAVVTTDANGNATFTFHRPAAFDFVALDESSLSEILRLQPDWIYFGTLAHTTEKAEQRLKLLLNANPYAKRFYDINLRDGHWNLDLVQRLSRLASIIKLNEVEAEQLFELANGSLPFSIEAFCRNWSSNYGGEVICVTLGSQGCAVWQNGQVHIFRGFPVTVVDTVGAGDAFTAAFLHGYQSGWPIEKTATFANALGAIVASRAGATPVWTIDECLRLTTTWSTSGQL
jgi:fructokinase